MGQLDPKRPEPHMKVVYEFRRVFAHTAGSTGSILPS
jgi:hypothetical protein